MDDGRPVSGSEVGGEKSPQPRAVENSSDAVQGRSRGPMTAKQRIVLLDIWERSGASAEEFGELEGVTGTTLYQWRRRFLKDGPLGLMDKPRGVPKGKPRLPQATQRAIVLMKSQHPDWAGDRIHDMLVRCEGYGASPGAILNVLREAGTSPRRSRRRRGKRPCIASSARGQISSGSRISSLSCSSAKTAGCGWSLSWTTTAASSSGTACGRAPAAPWCARCWKRRSRIGVRQRKSSPTTARSTRRGG